MIETEMGLMKQLTRIADALEKLAEQNNEALEIAKKQPVWVFQKEEKELRRTMQDPKYWRDQDPETVRRVEEGFKRLYYIDKEEE